MQLSELSKIANPITDDMNTALTEKYTEMCGHCKAASFRLFGTLIEPPFTDEADLYRLMEDDFRGYYSGKETFAALRTAAEDSARKKNMGKCNVSIAEIYDILMKKSKISEEACYKLMRLECTLFEDYAYVNSVGYELYRTAFRKKKRIIVLADTIYPRDMVERIVGKWLPVSPDSVIVTNELDRGIGRDEAVMLAIFSEAKCKSEKILHVGSDIQADIETAIVKGAKALLKTETTANMVKSGRLRGYIQQRLIYDYEKPEFLALHSAFGLYSGHRFAYPRPKLVQSDFCGSAFDLGFIVFGTLGLIEDFEPENDIQRELIRCFESSRDMKRGAEAFAKYYAEHFGSDLDGYGTDGCELPLVFLADHAGSVDREMFRELMDADLFEKWSKRITEPSLAPVYKRASKQNAVSKLADNMFPPGTKVRNIVDGMLVKMKSKKH